MGFIFRVRIGLEAILGFTLVFLLLHLSKTKASSLGTCFKIRYKDPNGCGRLLHSEVSRSRCCTGHHRRAWRPDAIASPTHTQGQINEEEQQGTKDTQESALRNASFAIRASVWRTRGGGIGGPRGVATSGGHLAAQGCQPCNTSCQDTDCEEDKKCVLRNGIPKCVCSPKCHLQHKAAVCGTDGRTYSSECQLLKRSCRKKQLLFVARSGACQTCNGVKCRHNRSCVLDELLTPRCIRCPRSCRPKANKRRAICGTDGITYASKCLLKLASCKAGVTINRAYKGTCVENAQCHTVKCWSGESCLHNFATKKPQCLWCGDLRACAATTVTPHICAADRSTYQSRCALQHASCKIKRVLTPMPLHYCAKNITMIEDDSPFRTLTRRKDKLYKVISTMQERERELNLTHHYNISKSKISNIVDMYDRENGVKIESKSEKKFRRKMGVGGEAKRRWRRRRKKMKEMI